LAQRNIANRKVVISDDRSARFMNEKTNAHRYVSVNGICNQLGLKHGAVTNAYVSPIAPALPDNNRGQR